MKFLTCENNIVELIFSSGTKTVIIPLLEIKERVWSNIFGRYIDVHFKETFKLERECFVFSEDNYKVFERWVSKKID